MNTEYNNSGVEYISKREIDAVLYQRKALLPSTDLQRRIINTFRLSETFRRSYGEYLFEQDADRKSIQTAINAIKKYKHMTEVNVEEYRDLIIDLIYSKYILGFKHLEYFLFDFEHTPILDRMNFLSENKRDYYYSKLNDCKEENRILDNKYSAFQLLKPYYNRDVINVSGGDGDLEAFTSFAKAHPRFIMKPAGNYGGKGVSWVECGEQTDINELYNSLVSENKRFVCEEPVIAPDYMKKMYPNSINTVRVLTYYNAPDEPVIVAALLRVGQKGAVVDNFSSGGIIAAIDINTGVVNTGGVDKINNRYATHPDTGTAFEGFKIENWEELIPIMKKLPLLLPKVRLIGWDMAASVNNGWQVIEGNVHPWIEMHQFCGPKGLKPMLEKVTEWEKHGI